MKLIASARVRSHISDMASGEGSQESILPQAYLQVGEGAAFWGA